MVQMGWKLFSFDVSSAFLQGLPFEQQSMIAPSGAGSERTVHLETPKGPLELVKQPDGVESFDPLKHVLKMVKGGFGLKDAPRMWRERLHQLITELAP